jgi:hypothetical protein
MASFAQVLIGGFTYINFISYRFVLSVSIVDFSRSVIINIHDTLVLFVRAIEEKEDIEQKEDMCRAIIARGVCDNKG